MKHNSWMSSEPAHAPSAILYDRLERAVIALEYALADARKPGGPSFAEQSDSLARSQEALLSAGEEVQEILSLLKTAALGEAAARFRNAG